MAAAAVDIGYLSTFLDIPQQTLHAALDDPTADLVTAVLQAVTARAHAYEELQADKFRLEIELENAVRGSENRSQGLKATVDKALKDVEEVREQLTVAENTRSSLEIELQQLKNSSAKSLSDVASLRARISSLEAANRDALGVIESKSTVHDRLVEDLQRQHQKTLDLAQQVSTLQQTVQNANSLVSSAKFREQSLQQELEQSKRSNEWLDTELKTKTAEYLKYRKEKGARIAELQRLNDDTTANLEALKRNELALRSRLDDVQKKADESLARVQQLQEAAAAAEESFRQEMESSRRLAELQSQQADTHRSRLKEVEASFERAKDDTASKIAAYQQELDSSAQEQQRLEHRIAELEAEVDRLEATAAGPVYAGSVPGTPRQGLNGLFGRGGSPATFGTPTSARKTTITATQAIDELYKVKGQLTSERRRNERLAQEMEDIMQGLEAKQPEIEEMQAEHRRLQQEMVQMSKFIDDAGKERDRAKKEARKAEADSATAQTEAVILQQQLRDLSAQVKFLLCSIDARERGYDALTHEEQAQLERLSKGEISEGALDGLTHTDRFISENLTVFRDIGELQRKNEDLLKITRQLGAKMESDEALKAKNQAAKDHEQVKILEAKIETFQDELRATITQSASYIKERDMFRRMLQHRGQLPANSDVASLFGQSVDGNAVMASIEQSPNNKDNTNYATLLRELQSHFDQYREEQSVDRRTLKEQMDKLSSEKGALQSEIAKISSQLTLASERYEMLHANYTMLQNENRELQKRSQVLSEAAAKQDLRTEAVAEDLIEAKGLLESMRNETANLKAEKRLWKEIQDRLSQDNESLMNEKNRLNGLVASQQTLQNERDISEAETRRRLQSQVESLETELSSTRRKLNDEVEDSKKKQERKDYEAGQAQKRIDDLAKALSLVREELVAAKTTRDHLQARVDELTIELKSAEERVELLQPRPTPRSGANGTAEQEDPRSREQELSIEVSELKRDLELSKSELENVRGQMEQYKAISQASEEELQSMNETQDQFQQQMNAEMEERATKIRELEQRVEDISAELSNANTELNAVRDQQSRISQQAQEERAGLEAEIARLRDEDDRHATVAQIYQQDLRAQAEIASKAQQDYEHELVKHAEAAKSLQTLRTEYNQLRTESRTYKSEAESAKVALSQSQISWEEMQEKFEKELNELRTTRDDIGAQNKLLHQQLESLGAQVTALQQNRAAGDHSDFDQQSASGPADRSVDGLRELVTYLRRDKEIVDVQYELSMQESKRLRQQLEYAQSQLDEARLKLDQERRMQADGSRTSMAHKDLMEKLNELNLFRESSITLRNEARQAQAQLAEKSKKVEELLSTIEPMETKVRELENMKETQDGQIRLLQEDRDRWQKRNQEILSKHDRIDPAEVEQLKESVAQLTAELETLTSESQPLREKVEALEVEKEQWAITRGKIVDQAKERSRVLTKDKNERIAERDAAIQQNEALEQQLSILRQELDTAIKDKQALEEQLTTSQQELSFAKAETERVLSASNHSNVSQHADALEPISTADRAFDHQLAAVRKELETAIEQKHEVEQQLATVRQELENARVERDQAIATVSQLHATDVSKPSDIAMENGVEDGQVEERLESTLPDSERKALQEQIAVAEEKAKAEEAKLAEIESKMDNIVKERSERMKSALNKKLIESREAAKVALEAEFSEKLAQEKQKWLAESGTTSGDSTAKPQESEAATAPQPPATPTSKPTASSAPDLSNLSDPQLRELLSTNPTAKSILSSNLKKKVEIETQKIKEEYEKTSADKISEVERKAEEIKIQAVTLESKKSALQINMANNKLRMANAVILVVKTAAETTPEKPVGEVWEVAKDAKPPAVVPPSSGSTAQTASQIPISNAISSDSAAKTEVPKLTQLMTVPNNSVSSAPGIPAVVSNSTIPALVSQAANGNAPVPVSNIPIPAAQAAGVPRTGIPRGGGATRGRGAGGQPYQAPRNGSIGTGAGRGRGGGPGQAQRGGMNPGAQTFSPGAGTKRPRDESQTGGQQDSNNGKRIRGGGGGS